MVQNANMIQTRRNYAPTEVIRQPIFWLMYFMFVIVGAGGLMVTANLKPIAADWKIDAMPVTLMGMTMTAVTFAATIDRVLNGLTRPFFGWISDMIGRENTMFIAFGIEGIGIWALYMLGHDPVWFVILSGLVFFAWGEIYSLFPSTCTDTFGVEIRDHQCRPALYRQGHRGAAGAGGELHAAVVGQLGQRVPDRRRRQYSGLAARDRGPQALAQGRGRQGGRLISNAPSFGLSSHSALILRDGRVFLRHAQRPPPLGIPNASAPDRARCLGAAARLRKVSITAHFSILLSGRRAKVAD